MAFSFESQPPFQLPIGNFASGEMKSNLTFDKFYYTIQAPKSVRPNSDFTLSLTIHDANCEFQEPIVVRITIQDADKNDAFKVYQDVVMKPNATEMVKIPIGEMSFEKNYELVVKGTSGITLEHKASLDLQTQIYAIFIQTDKAIYKPNDCIRYRILVLDTELKAASINSNELNIQIFDPSRNLLKKLDGVNTVSGVFSGEYQLSDVPSFGEWKIQAKILDQEKTATIEVAKYVLPKFEVAIESPDYFTFEDEKVAFVVRGKYTHGKPLRGTVIVSVFDENMMGSRMMFIHSSGQIKQPALAMKTVIMDGRENVEFDLKHDLKFDKSQWYNDGQIKLKADFTETLTGLTQSTEKMVEISKNAYKITTDLATKILKHDTKIDATISVRKRDGSLVNFINSERKKITIIRESFLNTMQPPEINEMNYELNNNSDAHITVNIDKSEIGFSLKAIYMNEESELGTFYVRASETAEIVNLQAKILTEQCTIGKEIQVEISSPYAIPSYTYMIIGRGRILESKTIATAIDRDDTNQSKYAYQFSFVPNFDYVPKANILIYCIRNRSIVSASTSVALNDDFKNFIELNVTPNTAKPGQIVDINIKTNPNSYVGLLGIDKSVLILRSGNDLSCDDIWRKLEHFHTQVKKRMDSGNFFGTQSGYRNHWMEFSNAGLITFSNVEDPFENYAPRYGRPFGKYPGAVAFSGMPMGGMLFKNAQPQFGLATVADGACREPVKPVIRKEFPETWIWESIHDTSANELFNLRKKVPDSLTTWILTGFSIDPLNGLAITKKPCELLVQQQFLISINLPYSVKRGEIVTVPCSVFNYLPNEIDADVTLENEYGEFEFIDSAVNDQIYPEIMKQQFRKKKLTIASQDAMNALFTIRPIKIGSISLKVSAVSSTVGDCVIKTLNVECEGVPQFVNKAVYIDLREKSHFDPIELQIEIPKLALADSTRIEITCLGDLLGGTIKNLQNLIRLPFGCGEQNMLNFVPNIVVLNYLRNTHQLTAEIEVNAKKYMEIGYQRELSYKHEDGSFSAFGEHDESGSTWLTAFVARSFRQAAEHIAIQDDIIDKSLKWLSETQANDGSFIEKGSICHKEMQSGSSNGVALTAYVLTAFLVNKNFSSEYSATIQKAIQNIIKSIENCTDVYALSVSAYALQLADHESKNMVISRLMELAKSKENQKWWDKSIETTGCCYRKSKTLNVEITAYALLTLQSSGNGSECLPILKWLLNQRNSKGGFEGTQDTIVGIEALANLAAKISSKNTKVNIDVSTSTGIKFDFSVDAENSLVLQSQKLEPDVKTIHISANGEGFALLELSYRYHIDAPEPEAAFSLQPNVKLVDAEHMSLETIVAYKPLEHKDLIKQSNMVVLEITLPSGFVVNSELLDGLKSTQSLIKRIETKGGDTVAIIYFDHLTLEPITLKVDGFREHLVEEQKPASILIYDYYDNALSAREFYSLPAADTKTHKNV